MARARRGSSASGGRACARVGVGAGRRRLTPPRSARWRPDCRPRATASSGTFRLGEDVVHAAFGEGVVTGVEPGGIIVVRFAGDGSERKLMADFAPVRRR